MKYISAIMLILTVLFCCCNPVNKKEINELELRFSETALGSSSFDSLVDKTLLLKSTYAIPILLKASLKQAISDEEFKKKETCLIHAYNMASHKTKKEVLTRMVAFYYEEMYCFAPTLEMYGLSEGYKRCCELEQYSLSKAEWENLIDRKAEYLRWMEEYEMAIKLRYELLSSYEKRDDIEKTIIELRSIATLFYLIKDPNKSWEINLKAYTLSEKKGLKDRQIGLLAALSSECIAQAKYDEAIEFLKKLDILLPKMSNQAAHFKLAEAYAAKNEVDIAREYLFKMLDTNSPLLQAETYQRIAETYIQEEREDSAYFFLKKSLDVFLLYKESEQRKEVPKYMFSHRFPYTAIGYVRLLKKNGKSAEALQMMDFIKPIIYEDFAWNSPLEAIKALDLYISIYRQTGDTKSALAAFDFRDSLQNDLSQREKKDNFENITFRLKNKEFIAHTKQYEQKISYSNRILILTIFLIIALIGIASMFWWMYSRKKKQLSIFHSKQQQIDLLKKEAEALQKSPPSPEELSFRKIEMLITQKKRFRDLDLTLEKLSQESGINRAYLSACINNCSGKNFNQWLNGFRIDYVLERINEQSDLPKLFTEAGFSSSASFYRSFKQYTSMSPKQYIEEMKKKQ